MEAISKDRAIKIFHQKGIALFTVGDAQKIFGIKNQNTLYKLLQRLEKAQVVKRIIKGKYRFLLKEVNDFELANFLVNPSYISLESALSFYGILPQFPYTITSVTPLKSKKIVLNQKEYEFAHLQAKYFKAALKQDGFLIALPEKALLDELYFLAKKLRSVNLKDLDLKRIDKTKLKKLAKEYDFLPLQKLLKNLKLF